MCWGFLGSVALYVASKEISKSISTCIFINWNMSYNRHHCLHRKKRSGSSLLYSTSILPWHLMQSLSNVRWIHAGITLRFPLWVHRWSVYCWWARVICFWDQFRTQTHEFWEKYLLLRYNDLLPSVAFESFCAMYIAPTARVIAPTHTTAWNVNSLVTQPPPTELMSSTHEGTSLGTWTHAW